MHKHTKNDPNEDNVNSFNELDTTAHNLHNEYKCASVAPWESSGPLVSAADKQKVCMSLLKY